MNTIMEEDDKDDEPSDNEGSDFIDGRRGRTHQVDCMHVRHDPRRRIGVVTYLSMLQDEMLIGLRHGHK
jgi:hypothetical protein